MQEYFPCFPQSAVARFVSLMRSASAISPDPQRLLHPTLGFPILIFLSRNHFEAFPRARDILFPSSSSSSSSASSPTILCLPQSPSGVLAKMEMEEIADKNDVEVNVLGKNPSLRSTQRFPRDEAVLARFGKQQQFRVSSPLQLSSFRAALAGRARIIPETLVADTRCCARSEDSVSYPSSVLPVPS